MKIATSAGHSYASDGAQGNGYSEHNEAVRLNNAFIALCNKYGVGVADCTSEAHSVNGYINEQVSFTNASGANVAIQWHFNSAGTPDATGTEVLYYEGSQRGLELATAMSHELSKALGIQDRGAKDRWSQGSTKTLGFIGRTNMESFIIETAFISNPNDMYCYINNIEDIVKAVFKVLTGIEVDNVNKWIWDNNQGKWWYKHADGTYTKDNFELVDGYMYYFDKEGWMLSDTWLHKDDKWYYFERNGKIVANKWKWVNNFCYSFDINGVMRHDVWVQDSSSKKWYYVNDKGQMLTNALIQDKEEYFFLQEDGTMATSRTLTILDKVYNITEWGKVDYK